MKQFRLYKISAWSLFKIGFLVGSIGSFLPIALVSLIFVRIMTGLSNWLGGLVYRIELPLPGNFGFDINVVELLKLEQAYEWLAQWAALRAIPLLFLILLITAMFGLFWGVVAGLGALVFNLLSRAIGGVQLSLTEISPELRPASVTSSGSPLPAGEGKEETDG